MRLARCAWLLPVLLGIAGCSPAVTKPATSGAATTRPPQPRSEGIILSMRPVVLRNDPAPWRVALLADASGAVTAGDEVDPRLMEFIVRIDGGSIISVVQANESGFLSGDRVIVLHDSRTHIARAG